MHHLAAVMSRMRRSRRRRRHSMESLCSCNCFSRFTTVCNGMLPRAGGTNFMVASAIARSTPRPTHPPRKIMPVHRTRECVRKHVRFNASLLCSSDERTEKIVKNLGPTGIRTTLVAGFRRFHGLVVCRKGWDTGCPTVAHSMPPGGVRGKVPTRIAGRSLLSPLSRIEQVASEPRDSGFDLLRSRQKQDDEKIRPQTHD